VCLLPPFPKKIQIYSRPSEIKTYIRRWSKVQTNDEHTRLPSRDNDRVNDKGNRSFRKKEDTKRYFYFIIN